MLNRQLEKIQRIAGLFSCGFGGALLGGELLAAAMVSAPQCDWLAPRPESNKFALAAGAAPASDLLSIA